MKKWISKFMGAVGFLLLAFLCISNTDVNSVKAVTTNAGNIINCEGGSFYVEPVSSETAVIDGKTMPSSTVHPDWLFAGWFLDDQCKQAVKQEIDGVTTYYAKFVSPEVLSVKLQIKNNASISEETNMRIISSVDSLDYLNVGFKVYFDQKIGTDKTSVDAQDTVVYEKIVTSSQSGITYNYSPQVIDVDSKYFITATLVNIKKASYTKPFHIVPYWTTYDGVQVYGASRYVTIQEDALNANVANIPAKIDAETGSSVSVKTGDASPVSANVVYHDGTYAHIRLQKPNVSLTKYIVSNASNDTTTVYYRNYSTKYNGTSASADTSWYDAYKEDDGTMSRTKFTIATSADLYGLASVSLNNNGLKDKVVYMVTDIQANKGAATSSGWKKAAGDGTQYEWTPVGTSTIPFRGIIDGNGFTIDGICISSCTSKYMGLFGYATDCTIGNLYLKNSYFNFNKSSYDSAECGSFLGSGDGNLSNLYSDAIICSTGNRVAGIMGSVQDIVNNTADTIDAKKAATKMSMNNCWFDGEIILNVSGVNLVSGGIVGMIAFGEASMSNCLYTGDLTVNYSGTTSSYDTSVGGLVGGNNFTSSGAKSHKMQNCLNAGTVVVNVADGITITNVGKIIGRHNLKLETTSNNLYATPDCGITAGTRGDQYYTPTTIDLTDSTALEEVLETFNTNETLWCQATLRGGNMLIPNAFSANAVTNTTDTSWYDGPNATAGTESDPYVIRSSNDLYGLAYLVNNEKVTFAGKYIELVDDIVMNHGNANDWDKDAPAYTWTPIGTSENAFQGWFNGNGHEINGLYVNRTTEGAGLFGYAANGGVSNLYLVNSFINTTGSSVGSIVGRGEGTFTNIYSDAIIHSTSTHVGGIIGNVRDDVTSSTAQKEYTVLTLKNCWFDGTIQSTRNAAYTYAGGLVGLQTFGETTIDDSLFTGTINYIYSGTVASDSRIGGLIGTLGFSNAAKGLSISNALSAGTINVINEGSSSVTYIGSVIGRAGSRASVSLSNAYVSTDSYATISDVSTYNDKVSEVDLTSSDSVNDCLTAMNITETSWEVREIRNQTMPVPKIFKTFEYDNAIPVCIYDSELTYDSAQGGLRIYLPTKKGYVNYNFVHSVDDSKKCDMWRLSVACLADYNLNALKEITKSGAEWEMALHLNDEIDFIGGYAHGDEIYESLRMVIDGVETDIMTVDSYKSFDEMKITVTSTGYNPANEEEAVLEHTKEYTITVDGITLDQEVKWLGEYTLATKWNSFLAMMPPFKYAEGNSSDVLTDTYCLDNSSISTTIPNPVSLTLNANEGFCVYGIDSGLYFTMSQTNISPAYESGGAKSIADNSGQNYNKMYISFAKGDTVTAETVWTATTTYQIDWK